MKVVSGVPYEYLTHKADGKAYQVLTIRSLVPERSIVLPEDYIVTYLESSSFWKGNKLSTDYLVNFSGGRPIAITEIFNRIVSLRHRLGFDHIRENKSVLIECPLCKKEVASDVGRCPHCGSHIDEVDCCDWNEGEPVVGRTICPFCYQKPISKIKEEYLYLITYASNLGCSSNFEYISGK